MKNKLKILHLEDMPADAELVERELKKGNIQFEKLVVDNKKAFESALIEFAPDIIISDHTLPSFDSFEAIKILRKQGITSPLILVTATVSDEFAVEIMKAGANDYILKDRLHRLPQAVENAMAKHNTEQKLRENEIFNRGVLSSLSTHIAVIDQNGTLIAVNKAWEDYGHENGTINLHSTSTKSNYFDVCNQAIENGDRDAAAALAGIKSVLEGEKKYFEMEYPCHSPEKQQWFKLSVENLGSNTNKVVISHQNITERMIAKNKLNNTSLELQKTLSELNQILDSSLDVICTINANGEFVRISAASQTMWGFTPEELIGSKFINLVYEEDLDITTQAAEKILLNIQIPTFENRYVHKSGRIVPLLWSIYWDEKLQLMYCVAKDVSEKKNLEKAVETERDEFFEIFSKAPSAIGMLKGPNHVFEMANPLYLQSIGTKDIVGKTVAEVLPEVIEQGFVSMLDNVYHTGESYTGTEMLVKIDKEEYGKMTDIYIDFVYQAYKNSMGEIEGIFFFINDVTEQVVSKQKIEKSEKQYRQIVETAQEGIWQLDENSRVIFVNKKICEILEYTEAEMMGKAHSYFLDQKGKEKAVIALKRRKKGIVESYNLDFISKNGKHVLTSVSAKPIFDDKGNFKGSLGMVSDITEKKHLEDLLEKSNRLARIGSWEIDVVKGTVFWSDITKEIREVELDFIPDLSTGLGYFHEGANRKTISQRVQQCIEEGTPWDEELQITTFKGNLKWVRTIGQAEFVKGKCSKVYGSFQDITERKNAVEKVIRSEAKLNVAQYIAHVGSYEVDMLTNTRNWSDEFYRILGINAHVTPSREAFLTFVHPYDRPIVESTMEDAYSIYSDALIHFRFISKNGETGYAAAEWQFEFDANGQPLYIHGILRDLTKEKKAESERVKMISDLVQRNSDLEQFSYIVSHNLRAPTANIIGFAEVLQDETLMPHEQKECLQGLTASVSGLDTVIKDINTILQSKRQVHEKKEVIIFSKLVNNIILSIGDLIEKHRVRIISDFSEVDEIYSLKIYIYSILYNLISNSIKYGQPNKPPLIEIKSKREKGKIILTFKDNGLGIDMKTKGDKIFGLYNRFHSHVEGKGMGLFMVKTQVESLGGKIAVTSEPNKGTEFTIEFDN